MPWLVSSNFSFLKHGPIISLQETEVNTPTGTFLKFFRERGRIGAALSGKALPVDLRPLRQRLRAATSPGSGLALSVSLRSPAPPKGEPTHVPDKAQLCTTSPSLLRNATSPSRGGSGVAESPASSPLRCEETSLPKAPLPGELSNEVRLRGCTKDGPNREPQPGAGA